MTLILVALGLGITVVELNFGGFSNLFDFRTWSVAFDFGGFIVSVWVSFFFGLFGYSGGLGLFLFFEMTGRRDDSPQSIGVQLDGTKYSYWSYVMRQFLRGKSMWGYVIGVRVKPTNEKATDYANLVDVWETENTKIITWINNSVTHSIGALLAKYETAKEVWDHLERIYTQSDFAKQFSWRVISGRCDRIR